MHKITTTKKRLKTRKIKRCKDMKKETKEFYNIKTRKELRALKNFLREEKKLERKEKRQQQEMQPIIIEEIDTLTNKVKSITITARYKY